MKVKALFFFITCAPLTSHGSSSKEISGLDVVVFRNGRPSVKHWPYKDINPSKSFDIISPSPTNEGKKKQTWAGRLIRDFLPKDLHANRQLEDSLVLTSNDFYVSSPKSEIIINHDAIVALETDGQRIPWSNGGPQVMLPFGAPDLPLEYNKHAWCPWFLTTIIIGEGEPILATSRNGVPQGEIDLRDRCKKAERWNISYPRGQWHVPPEKKSMAEISKCSLSSLFGASTSTNRTITFHSLNGSHLTLNASSEKHYLSFAWDGKRIPARFGGPIQLCFDGDHTDCQFFVYKADIRE